MRQEYGEKICDQCGDCCNRQLKSRKEKTMICIAYDNETPWERHERACGLFNVPFRGIRPKRTPLGEYLERKTRHRPQENTEEQASLFDTMQ